MSEDGYCETDIMTRIAMGKKAFMDKKSLFIGKLDTDLKKRTITRMWANAQPDGRPVEHRWRPLFNAAKFG